MDAHERPGPVAASDLRAWPLTEPVDGDLKTIVAMPFVLDGDRGRVDISALCVFRVEIALSRGELLKLDAGIEDARELLTHSPFTHHVSLNPAWIQGLRCDLLLMQRALVRMNAVGEGGTPALLRRRAEPPAGAT